MAKLLDIIPENLKSAFIQEVRDLLAEEINVENEAGKKKLTTPKSIDEDIKAWVDKSNLSSSKKS
jgi:hypothetical protein